jgi:retron-type reverse transcriptase
MDFLCKHGNKPLHSCTTALLPLGTTIAMGFNEAKPASRTVLVALDLAKAFDAVNHDLLLEKVSNTELHSNIVTELRPLKAYLRGCTAVCLFQGATSTVFKCHSGVPQGSVISLHLFNFFVHDFPSPAEVNESYADDFHLARSSPDADSIGPELTEDLKQVTKWSEENKLGIAPAKSTVTLFSPHN